MNYTSRMEGGFIHAGNQFVLWNTNHNVLE